MPSIFLDYAVPTRVKLHALHDTTLMPGTTIAVHIVVTTAGVIPMRMHGDTATVLVPLAIGQWLLPGNWALAKTTDATAVITGSIVCYYAEVAGLKH